MARNKGFRFEFKPISAATVIPHLQLTHCSFQSALGAKMQRKRSILANAFLKWNEVRWVKLPNHSILFVLLLKPAAQAQVLKTNMFTKLAYETPHAPQTRKTERQTQGSNQLLTAPLNPSNVSVSNTVQGR